MRYTALAIAFLGTVLLAEPHTEVRTERAAAEVSPEDSEIQVCYRKLQDSRSIRFRRLGTFSVDSYVPDKPEFSIAGAASLMLFEQMEKAGLTVETKPFGNSKHLKRSTIRGEHLNCYSVGYEDEPKASRIYRCTLKPDPKRAGAILVQEK
jgi:hypothetical protein